MDWFGLFINVVTIFIGLGFYIGICNSKWGKEHTQYQYAIMLAAVLLACVAGWLLRQVLGLVL
jgi:hypothetical protein